MKQIVITVFIMLFAFNQVNAQKRDKVEYQQNWDKQKVFWGYYLGLNMKNYRISYKAEGDFINVTPAVGFDVGLIGDLRLHENLSLRLEPGLSSNTKELDFTYIPGGTKDSIRKVGATYLRVPLLLKFNTDRYNNIRPYVVGGVSYDYNFSSNEDNPDDNSDGEFRMKKSNFSYELGLGIDIYMPYFIFSPSIRGIFGINDELVRDNDPNSPWTGNVDHFTSRGIFLKLAFH
ncbi:PorT family protein [Lutibacter sp. HS1-25]|uniref:type IX secretion/gliding motility protein PorT/SprT n=1 Tax=Lutibacter sp. HS1-25 TaxID=2485000 RepID=UPI0010128A73|nr:porin family protein [Lutibacter sp. HS1-25]RXP54092.1 PorT family protein [Lutibacter sp. HS1-25]